MTPASSTQHSRFVHGFGPRLLRSPAFCLSRWWQSLGFGIQSRTDYDFLHDVIRERLPYYAYDDIKQRFPDATTAELKCARLLFRIANHLKPTELRTMGSPSPLNMAHLESIVASTARCGGEKQPQGVLLYAEGEVDIPHFHGYKAIVLTHIDTANAEVWQRILAADAVTYDMRDIGLALFYQNRAPEHYRI